jgi:hypothetical protein
MAYQGKARGTSFFDLRHKNKADVNLRPSLGMTSGKDTKEQEAKQAYTWLKDAHAFAQANKDNLDDPDVQDVLQMKMDKAEQGGLFTRTPMPRSTESGPTPGGSSEAAGVEGSVAMPQDNQMEGLLRNVEQLKKRFLVENPAVYKPSQANVMKDGEYGRYEFDPIHGEKKLGTPVEKVAEGSALVAGDKVIYEREKTAAPSSDSDMKSAWKEFNARTGEDIGLEVFKRKYWDKLTGTDKDELTRYQKLNILYDVEQQIQKVKDEDKDFSQDMIDMWNRQLEKAGIEERVSMSEVKKEPWYWFNSKEQTVKVGADNLRREGESIEDFLKRQKGK